MPGPYTAVPPLDDDLEDVLADLAGIHPGVDLIRQGVRCLANAQLTPDQTQTLCATLAGSHSADVVTLIGLLVQRLADPASNPALRSLPEARQKAAQAAGEEAAYLLSDPDLHQPAADAASAISPAT
jgi:hypothetical protein